MEKKCKKCNAVKDVSEFSKRKSSKDGFRNECRVCCKEYREANKERAKEYREANKEKAKQYREVNKKKPTLQELEAEAEKKRLFEDGKKKCNKCNVVKDVSEFYKNKITKDGFGSGCKSCLEKYSKANKEKNKQNSKEYYKHNKDKAKEYYKANKESIANRLSEYYKANKEKIKEKEKQYREANKEKIKEKQKKYYEANKDKAKEYRETNKDKIKEYYKANKEKIKEYRETNKDKIKEGRKKHYQANKEKVNNYVVNYHKSRIKTDSLFRLKWSTRANIYRYLKDGKSKRTREVVGIDFKEFQDYLEVEYTEGMHLDHIIPLSWANNDEEVYILNHYSNFQIITAEENLAKKDTYCKSENLKKVLDNHNDLTKLNQIIERNSDKIK